MKKTAIIGLTALLCATFASQAVYHAKADSTVTLDFSHAGNVGTTVGAAEFIEDYLKLNLYGSEREFFESHDFAFKYSGKIAGKYLFSKTDEDGSTVQITAKEYSYKAENGQTVVWRPYAIGDVLFEGETCEVPVSEEDFVTVTYRTDVSLSYAPINKILNLYYDEAAAIAQTLALKESEDHAAMAQYQADLARYGKYLSDKIQYDEEKAAYDQYIKDRDIWKKNFAAYTEYLEKLAEFEQQTKDLEEYRKKYDAYVEQSAAYDKYLRELEAYKRELEKYQQAISDPNIAKAKHHIEILEYMDTPAGNNRTLSAAITGSTVTTVLARLSDLDSYLPMAKIESITISRAKKATDNLRDLIGKYHTCVTDADKYSFYMSNYESLKKNFCDLLRTLDYMYAKPMVHDEVKKQDKVEQFDILLAQLYYMCNALDDEVVKNYQNTYYTQWPIDGAIDFTSRYRIDGKTPSAILGGVILEDTNEAEPLSQFPTIPKEPTAPEEVAEPVYPGARPPQPVEPDFVADPGDEPKAVKDPTEPEVVKEPTEPIPYIPSDWEKALATEFNSGTMSRRAEYSANLGITLLTTVDKYFRNAEGTINVSFYLDPDDDTPVFTAEMGRSDYIEYQGAIPTKTRRGYTCVWDGWSTARGGEKVDMDHLYAGKDINLYPHFSETPNLYDVVWIISGAEYRTKAAYESTPVYDGPQPVKSADANGRQYKFTGWDHEIAEMSDKTVWYTAEFEASVLISFKVDSAVTTVSVWAGETPEYVGVCEKPSDSYYYYTFSGWDKELAPAVPGKDERYTAQFTKHYILPLGSGGAKIVKSDDGSMYSVDYSRSQQHTVDVATLIDIVSSDGIGLTLRLSNATLNFTADQVAELADGGVSTVTAMVTPVVARQYRYRVDFTSQTRSLAEYSFTFTASGVFDTEKTQMFRIDGEGNSIQSRFTLQENSVTFQMRSGYTYELYPLYAVSVLPFEGLSEFYASTSLTKPNQTITIGVGDPDAGRTLDSIYVRDVHGNPIEIEPDYTFKMPSADVIVGVVCGYIEYTITFVVDGIVISSQTYHYGDTVAAPTAVFRSPDGEYSYMFAGWDKEIVTVTEDAEYTAIFTAERLPEPPISEPSAKMKLIIWIGKHLTLVLVLAVLFLLLLIILPILLTARVAKKRALRRKSRKNMRRKTS